MIFVLVYWRAFIFFLVLESHAHCTGVLEIYILCNVAGMRKGSSDQLVLVLKSYVLCVGVLESFDLLLLVLENHNHSVVVLKKLGGFFNHL